MTNLQDENVYELRFVGYSYGGTKEAKLVLTVSFPRSLGTQTGSG